MDNNRFYLVGLKERVHVGFAIDGLSQKEIAAFEGAGQTTRHIKIKNIENIDEKRLVSLIKLVHKKSAGVKDQKTNS